MSLAVKDAEVDGEHAQNKQVKSDPRKYPIRIHKSSFFDS